jgi:tyrosyl-tRNA synthetase
MANSKGAPENLQRPWEVGKSGNPGGRPKWKPLTDAIRKQLAAPITELYSAEQILKLPKRLQDPKTTIAEVVADALITEAIGGEAKVRAAREVMDRVEGRVPLPLIGSTDEPIAITILNNIPRPDRSKRKAKKPSKKERVN